MTRSLPARAFAGYVKGRSVRLHRNGRLSAFKNTRPTQASQPCEDCPPDYRTDEKDARLTTAERNAILDLSQRTPEWGFISPGQAAR